MPDSNMFKYLFYSMIFFLLCKSVNCQSNIKVEASASVNRLMSRYIDNSKSKDVVKVWRIQVLSTTDRREMESTLSTFRSLYPELISDWKHVSPNYQIRAGIFESKNKLMPLLVEIKKSFPSATSVFDNVSKKMILGN